MCFIKSYCVGSKERRIPYPTSDPFTFLFKFVSCPNYTYEVSSHVLSKPLYLFEDI